MSISAGSIFEGDVCSAARSLVWALDLSPVCFSVVCVGTNATSSSYSASSFLPAAQKLLPAGFFVLGN